MLMTKERPQNDPDAAGVGDERAAGGRCHPRMRGARLGAGPGRPACARARLDLARQDPPTGISAEKPWRRSATSWIRSATLARSVRRTRARSLHPPATSLCAGRGCFSPERGAARPPSLCLSFSHRSSSAWTRFSIAGLFGGRASDRCSCSRCAASNVVCAFATSFARLARSFSLAASSLRRSASRRFCSRSNSADGLACILIADLGGGSPLGLRTTALLPPACFVVQIREGSACSAKRPFGSRGPLEYLLRVSTWSRRPTRDRRSSLAVTLREKIAARRPMPPAPPSSTAPRSRDRRNRARSERS